MSYAIPMPYIQSPDAADAVKASTTTRVKKSRDHNIHVIERSDREIDILLPAGAEQLTLQQLAQSSSSSLQQLAQCSSSSSPARVLTSSSGTPTILSQIGKTMSWLVYSTLSFCSQGFTWCLSRIF